MDCVIHVVYLSVCLYLQARTASLTFLSGTHQNFTHLRPVLRLLRKNMIFFFFLSKM